MRSEFHPDRRAFVVSVEPTSDEIASAVVFLTSTTADYINARCSDTGTALGQSGAKPLEASTIANTRLLLPHAVSPEPLRRAVSWVGHHGNPLVVPREA